MYTEKDIHKVLLAGAGTMGSSFAQIFAKKGYDVTLYDISDEALDKAGKLIRMNLDNEIGEGTLTEDEAEGILDRITMTTSKDCYSEADFVLEAIAEKMEIKHAFFSELSEAAKPDAILCSNTSGLSITEIAKAVRDPERFCGMHWVNPPHLIPLVEVTAGEQSSDEVVDVVYNIAVGLGQKPVKVYKDPSGFILNRLQYALVREACHCVEMGYASLEDVDNVMKYGLGRRYACIGPFETMDLGGLHIFYNCGSYLFDDLCKDGGVPDILRELFEQGDLGVSTGKGFYDYSDGKDVEAINHRDKSFIAVARALDELEDKKNE